MLEIEPKSLHQKTPIFIGNEVDVKLVEKFMSEEHVKITL
ncbi:MAG: hypothetical protein Q8940_14415 [Bacteroidota bacterium]|nr:hypothetical protein [Bacteroidota bacterium]